LTQNRNVNDIHTLGAVLAETGQLKEARQMLVRYLASVDPSAGMTDAARYLVGRIAEGIGLRDTAQETYSAIARPKVEAGDSVYDLAQIRLKVMHQNQ